MKHWINIAAFLLVVFANGTRAFAADEAALNEADALLQSGEYDAALAASEKLIKAEPANGRALVIMGRAQAFKDQYTDALATFERAEKTGEKVDVYVGATQYHAGDNDAALRALERAVSKQPENADAHYFLGLARLKDNNYSGARESLAKARTLDSSLEDDSLYFSGLAAMKSGDTATGKMELQKVVDAAPDSEAGRSAKAVLAGGASAAPMFEAGANLSTQYDSNVLLVPTAGGNFTPGEVSNKSGMRGILNLRAAVTPTFGQWKATFGYGGYQSMHYVNRDRLKGFDLSNHTLSLGAARKTDADLLSIPYSLSVAFLSPDYKRFSTTHALSPAYARKIGSSNLLGASNAIGYEDFALNVVPATVDGEAIEQTRDNLFDTFSIFYSRLFNDEKASVTPSLSVLYSNATGKSSWDSTGVRGGLSVSSAFGEKWSAGLSASYTARNYANRFVTLSGSSILAEDRSDGELSGGANVGYRIGMANLTLGAAHVNNGSTIKSFEYKRTILTLGIGAQF